MSITVTPSVKRMEREACVLSGTNWSALCFPEVVPGSLSIGKPMPGTDEPLQAIMYTEGTDYEVDYQLGRIRRTETSAIPDWSESLEIQQTVVSSKETLRLFSAVDYTIYADYYHNSTADYEKVLAEINRGNPKFSSDLNFLKRCDDRKKLTYLVVGDSISTGAQYTPKSMQFFNLFAKSLEKRYAGLKVDLINYAIGGTSATSGMKMLESANNDGIVPDLISIAFGMNDQNSYKSKQSVKAYISYISKMIDYIQNEWPMTQILLITSMPPSGVYYANSGHSDEYADALICLGTERSIPIAEARALFQYVKYVQKKKDAELIVTNINHPGPFGHQLYFLAMNSLL